MQEIYKNPIGYYKICNYNDNLLFNENCMKKCPEKLIF